MAFDIMKTLKETVLIWVSLFVVGMIGGLIPQASGFLLTMVNLNMVIGGIVTVFIAVLIKDYISEKLWK